VRARGSGTRGFRGPLALERAEELARAIVEGPLDDPELASVERQLAAIRALDATYPQAQTSIEVELPADEAGIEAMGWQEMQQLAARLLGSETLAELPPT
jgi:hypothetical protein